MADNLCGPSNALQNFQKHTSTDRTLQQDRLTSRQTPAQSFRSAPGPNARILDPEFDAFQAGHAAPFHHQPGLHFPAPHAAPQHFAQAPQAPDWASDFQRLNISSPQPPPLLQHHRAPQASNHATSWHQDFLQQQAPAGQPQAQHQTMFGGIPRQGMAFSGPMYQQASGFGMMNGAPLSLAAQGKQRVQDDVPQFDDAAFEEAFKLAQQDALVEEVSDEDARARALGFSDHEQLNSWQEQLFELEKKNKERLLQARREMNGYQPERQLNGRNEQGATERTNDWLPIIQSFDKAVTVSMYLAGDLAYENVLSKMELLEESGELDAASASFVVENLQFLLENGFSASKSAQERTDKIIERINARLMSEHPLLSTSIALGTRVENKALEVGVDLGKMRGGWARAREVMTSAQMFLNESAEVERRTRILLEEHKRQQAQQQEPTQEQSRILMEEQARQQAQQQESTQEQEQEQPPRNTDDDDEMAATASQLLNSVADNTSEKFKNSQFLELMRKLRDREARVEEDKIVDVSNVQSSTTTTANTTATANNHTSSSANHPPTDAAIPPIDRGILNHAATDFELPVDSTEEIQNSMFE